MEIKEYHEIELLQSFSTFHVANASKVMAKKNAKQQQQNRIRNEVVNNMKNFTVDQQNKKGQTKFSHEFYGIVHFQLDFVENCRHSEHSSILEHDVAKKCRCSLGQNSSSNATIIRTFVNQTKYTQTK